MEAVVFDLDGVLLDTEEVWDEARRQIAAERGGRWPEDAQRAMMGMSSPEWSRYMHDVVGLAERPEEISAEVVARLETLYHERLPLIDGAIEAVLRIGSRWPLAIASSSNRPLIDLVLDRAGLADRFGMKPNTVRLIFLLSCLLPGPQFVVYLVLWVMMPKAGY